MSYSNRKPLQSSDKLTVNFIGQYDDQPVDCILENTFFQEGLLNMKLVLKYLQIDNTNVPLFIPKKLNSFPSWCINKTGWDYSTGTAVPITPTNLLINPKSIDYIFGWNTTDDYNTGITFAITQWLPQLLTAPVPSALLNQNQVVQNKYYFSYVLEHFLNILQDTLNFLANAQLTVNYDLAQPILIKYNGDTLSLLIPKKYMDLSLKFLFFNRELNDLFAFNSYPSASNPELFVQVFDTLKTVGSNLYYVYNSRYISRKWIAWDTILLTTNLPIKSVETQTNLPNTSSGATEYRNIIYILNTVENSLNFYPYYVYQQSTTDDYTAFNQDSYSNGEYQIGLSLYNKANGLSIPYTIKKNEVVTMNYIIKNN